MATTGDDDGRRCEIAIRPHTKSPRVYGKCRLLVTTHRHLLYILLYKSKNVGQKNFSTGNPGSTYTLVVIWSTTFPGLPMQVDG